MIRRVEHAARHAEILQSFGRLSKSAATSPVATPYIGGSVGREYFDADVDGDSTLQSRRRASGEWMHDTLPHSHGASYTADAEQHRRAWATQSPSHSHGPQYVFVQPRGGAPIDDSPSPRSTDEDLPSITQPSTVTHPGAYMTPSTSPFLGGISTLNIHSTQPSRAPSPILLPPPATRPGSPGDDLHRRRGRAPDSPPISYSIGRKRRSSDDYEPYRCVKLSYFPLSTRLSSCSLFSAPATQHAFSHQRGLSGLGAHSGPHAHTYSHGLTTPALSSGPSSNGSSPSSHAHSRAPSPTQSHHNHSHPYLAHSVRAAFGMTPIHATTPLPTPYVHVSAGPSVPTSRAGSPPIKLAPLRVPSPSALGDERGGGKSPRVGGGVSLPGFSEIEAATRVA
jgi:zinc-finger protein CreA/MIG